MMAILQERTAKTEIPTNVTHFTMLTKQEFNRKLTLHGQVSYIIPTK